ncbi:MAG: histidine phosphatase family protein [Propioniciclava sp.]|uniref:histidine phosphatase family protein n=1 Tax=Propioniciclava sp. TaxID=2038686 RepID=UPI0039E48C40
MSPVGDVPRDRVQRIVSDLAHARRTAAAIASRHGVTVQVVEALREQYGPDVGALCAAAEELAKPEPLAHPEEPAEVAEHRGIDGLTVAERAACRAWCAEVGVAVSAKGALAAVTVKAWREALVEALPGCREVGCGASEEHGHGAACTVSCPCAGIDDAEDPSPARFAEAARVVLLDAADEVGWAATGAPGDLLALISAVEGFVEGVRRERRVQGRVAVLADALYDRLMGGALCADRDDARRYVTRVPGKESECPECTEPVEVLP